MLIIAEKINATRKAIAAALAASDVEAIAKVAVEQALAGANYIDVNGGDPRPGQEEANIAWLLDIVQSRTELPVAIDTANPQAMRKGLSLAANSRPILNSISLESQRLAEMLPIAGEFDCIVVALLMSDDGPPCEINDRLARSEQLIEKLGKAGKAVGDIIIDPCFFPVSADDKCGRRVIDAIAGIRARWPEVHIGGGASNISFGLPKRRYINFALLSQAIYAGMDAAIIDPCVQEIIPTILAAEAVAGRDEFCMNYVTGEREGKLK
ncbi:MAG: dihydropteroate synthase [Planctomycetes bacterium]|nr:dihydropteroate synthase [Planctomycetota bacterium]